MASAGSGVSNAPPSSASISPQQPTLLFVIVGRNEPLFEADLSSPPVSKQHANGGLSVATSSTSEAILRQNYFVLHSALDLVDKATWTTSNMYLKVIDKVNNQHVSTFVTAGNVKFMLLHSNASSSTLLSSTHHNAATNNTANTISGGNTVLRVSEDSIKYFFQDVYELYVKFAMNPFYRHDTPIHSDTFESRVRSVSRKYLL